MPYYAAKKPLFRARSTSEALAIFFITKSRSKDSLIKIRLVA
jgi:hypothetical protein